MKRSCGAAVVLCAVMAGGCFGDRQRPSPVDPREPAQLTAQVLAPPYGRTVSTGQEIQVTVQARDLNTGNLGGVGFVARRFSAGLPLIDSASFRFEGRNDTTHHFTFVVPGSMPTNTQIDIYGIALSTTGLARLSEPSAVVVVQCPPAGC